jgi:putative transposase
MLRDAADELLAFTNFPISHWKKLWSTNPLGAAQQGDQAPHRRGRGLPQPRGAAAAGRAVLVEAHDEWQVSDRRYLSEGSMALLTAATKEVTPAQTHAGVDSRR